MTVVALDDAKAHLRVTFDSDDDYITSLIEAAEAYVQQVGVSFGSPLDPPVRQAVLLLVGHWYEVRAAVLAGAGTIGALAVPLGFDSIVAAYRENCI